MSTNRPLLPPTPTPHCATYAQLLPLFGAHELDAAQAEALRTHLADCAWCQSVLATYDVVEEALRRQFGPGHTAPRLLTMEAILRATDQEDRRSPPGGYDD
ncbi:MAG TPA: zf-HC2 domain-containing protein, partial [Ktedonobacterales bacterium]|nr:zf-HC2 domain-containing protein [Ktedonobacterales bacterium]